MIRRTSEMRYPLEAPTGWFLYKAEHKHTPIIYNTDIHTPIVGADGPFFVFFQKYPKGGRLVQGRGHTLEQAWERAAAEAAKVDLESM
jgi:hypothetical protein